MKQPRAFTRRIGLLCGFLMAGVFAMDVSIPLGFAGGVPYVFPILICLWSTNRRDIILAAAASSLLTILGYLLSMDGGHPMIVLANRGLALLAIWSVAFMTYQERRTKDALSRSNEAMNVQLASVQDLREIAEVQATDAVALAEDLSAARIEAEEATARAEADELRIRTVLNTVTDAIITIDSVGTIETFNPAAEAMFGYTIDEMVGHNISVLLPEPHRSSHDLYLKRFETEPARIAGTISEQVAINRKGEHFPIEISINRMRLGSEIKYTGVLRDITERKRAEDEIRRLALTDPLTGLANRNSFNQHFSDMIKMARRQERQFALLLLDLDKFKPVNDDFGHPAGDAVLQEVAARIVKHCRETDAAARIGGDEFAVLIYDTPDEASVAEPARRIGESISEPVAVGEHDIEIGVSIGISLFPTDGENQEDLVREADRALYQAKEEGRSQHSFVTP